MIGDSNNPKVSKNPAFAMLGLPNMKLPSKPWMIFWAVVGTLGGGIAFDKFQQRQMRKQYQQWGETVGSQPLDVREMPRKVRIYISPFPNDYLAEAMKYLKRFVKPILNSSGVDLKIVTMERQGDIRFQVAEEIRALRRKKAGLPDKKEPIVEEEIESPKTIAADTTVKNPHSPVFTSIQANRVEEPEETTPRHDLYTPMNVVSVKSLFTFDKPLKFKDANEEDVRNSGGIICIGRGAFKEYINGVNEGLLGPLYAPEKTKEETEEAVKIETEVKEEEKKKKEDEDYAPAPYIYANEYNQCELAPELPELHNLQECKDENGVGYFFVQPVLELRNYSISGFTKQFERMWRFYNKREQMEEYNSGLKRLIQHEWHEMNDPKFVGNLEEDDWPGRWKKDASEKNSEWVRDFKCDERVLKLLSTYNK